MGCNFDITTMAETAELLHNNTTPLFPSEEELEVWLDESFEEDEL